MATIAATLRGAAVLGISALVFGCAETAYLYRPAEQATATIDGRAAARYPIPPEAPSGDVRVASFGVMDINHPDEHDKIAVLHVRLVLSNDGGTRPWRFDARQVRVEIRGFGDAGVPLVNAADGTLPTVQIATGRERMVDLFYPLPRGADDDRDVLAFDVLWRVQTDTRLVAERTPFERIEIDRNPPRYSAGVSWYGPYWWYDPWYYPPAVVVRPGLLAPSRGVPPQIQVRPHPRR